MQYRRYLFWAILSFAAIVRLKGLPSGLPLHTLYGENDTFQTLQQMLHTGDLNPQQFVYPALAYYVYLPFLYVFYAIGSAFGYFNGIASVPDASWIFIGRCVSALLGTASVVVAYRIGRSFSDAIALLAMAIFAAVPQHIEFSHMLRPEIPAIFFLLLAQWLALKLLDAPDRKTYWLFGLTAGACFSTKYNIGLPLLVPLGVAWWLSRPAARWYWLLESVLVFGLTFAVLNPALVADPPSALYWIRKLDSYYVPSEDYYGKGVIFYYLEYLTRYNYNLPLILAAILGIAVLEFRDWKRGILIAAYPLCLFVWLCTFESRRIHGLLPLHPFLALWAASTLNALWLGTRRISGATFFRIAYTLLLTAILFFPYYRSCVQTYLFSRTDNRSKAELWMTNQLPRGSRIALLQYHQIELDPDYFQIEDFSPRDYAGQKNFHWFAEHGFDYVVLSSGQYMRYFVEGPKAESYKDYFLAFFRDAEREGTLVLDLITHPTLIPDYRIKVFSTHKRAPLPDLIPAVQEGSEQATYHLDREGSLTLPPGYYQLDVPQKEPFALRVKNLKFNEWILKERVEPTGAPPEPGGRFSFAIFPARLGSRISLFSRAHPEISPGQQVQFNWTGVPGIDVKRIQPDIEIRQVEFSFAQHRDPSLPYLLLTKRQDFSLRCTLLNHSKSGSSGYVQAFLSLVGEPQPWKNFEAASQVEEFFLESGQDIKIDVPFNTSDLTGDLQLSFWVFTHKDLPFSPQNGGWFAPQVRVDDVRLGIHPIYGIPIP